MADQSEMSNVEQEGNEEFYQILSDFIKRRDAGEDVDVEDLCQQHPQHAGALRSYAAGDGLLNAMLGGDVDDQISPHLRSSQSVSAHAVETVRPGASQATDTPMKEQFGRYRVVRILGEGAMGSIYLAEDTNLEREVALKIPKLTGMEGADFLQRFSREAKAAARLDHPFICRVYDADEHEGTPFITMAYIDGQPLSRFIGTPEFDDQRRVAEMIRDIAGGLEHAHQQQILHRDLKPGNVLVQIDGTPCITDFGLARRVDTGEESRITKEGAIIGTPAYMSPEQIEGHQDRIHSAADIYSLGVIFYELLTKQLPFQGSVMSILGQAMRDRPKPLSKIRSDVDSDLEQLCLKMLEKRPQDRPASMQEIVDELGKWLEKTPEDQQAADAKAKRRIAQLEDSKSKIKDLIERGQYAAALRRLEKLAAVTHPIAQEYVEWAKAKLPEVQAMPEKLQKGLPSLIASANKFISRNDYAQAADLLSKIPANQRNDEAQRLLDKAIDLQDEADLLLADLKDCVKRRQYKGIMENLDRFLELKPGNKFANDLHRALTSYGTGKRRKKKFRFDERGKLLPAQSDSIWDSFALWGAVAFLAVFGLVSWGIMIYLGDSGQKLAVEIDEQWLAEQGGKITLAVDGKEHTITGPGIDIKVALGKRGFSVKNGDTVVYNPETFTIEKEGRKILRIDATGMHFGTGGSNLDPDNENIARATNGQTETAVINREVSARQTTLIPVRVGPIHKMAFSPDGSRLASFNWHTRIYDIEKAEELGKEKWGDTWSGCWHPKNGYLLCGQTTAEIQFVNSGTFNRDKNLKTLSNRAAGLVNDVTVTDDGRFLASLRSTKSERYVEIVNTKSGKLKLDYTQSVNTGAGTGLYFDNQRNRLISISRRDDEELVVKIAELDDNSVTELPISKKVTGNTNHYSSRLNRIFIGDKEAVGTATVFDGTTGAKIGTIGENGRGVVERIAVSDNGRLIAMANSELNTVELIDLESLRTVGEIDLSDHYPGGLAFDGPGNRLAAYCIPESGRTLSRNERSELQGSIRIFELTESSSTQTPAHYALTFEKGDRVEIPTFRYDGTTPITMEGWVKTQTQDSPVVFSSATNRPQLRGEGIYLTVSQGKWCMSCLTTDQHQGIWSDSPVTDQWTHVAITRQGRLARLFVNGKLVNQMTLTSDFVPSQDIALLGTSHAEGYQHPKGYDINFIHHFSGLLDEVRFSDIVRYEKDFTPERRFRSDPQTIALYHCDNGTGTVLTDSSSNGNHGTIIGADFTKLDRTAPTHTAAHLSTTVPGVGAPRTPLPDGPTGLAAKLLAHKEGLIDLEFSHDGKQLISRGKDRTLRFWDLESQKLLTTIQAPLNVPRFAVSPNGIVSMNSDSEMQTYDINSHELLHKFSCEDKEGYRITYSADGRYLASVSQSGKLRVWNTQDISSPELILEVGDKREIAAGPGPKFVGNTSRLAVQQKDRTLLIYDLEKSPAERTTPRELSLDMSVTLGSMEFSPDGTKVLFINFAKTEVFDIQTEKLLSDTIQFHRFCKFLPGGQHVIGATTDNGVGIVDVESGVLTHSIPVPNEFKNQKGVNYLAVSPDGRFVATGGGSYWDGDTNQAVNTGDYAIYVWRLPEEVWAEQDSSLTTSNTNGSDNSGTVGKNDSTPTALRFDGNDWVDIPKLKYSGTKPLTVECFVAPFVESMLRPSSLVANFQRSGFGLQVHDGLWDFAYHDKSQYRTAKADALVEAKTVVHVAAVFDGRGISIFVDGKKQKVSAPVQGSHRPSKYPFMIGADPDHNGKPEKFFHGDVHSVRISEVARYTKDFPVPPSLTGDSNTVALYDMQRSVSGDRLVDLSGNGFDGKINGAKVVRSSKSPVKQTSAIETQIRQSLVLNKPTGSSKSPGISVVTAKGICTVRAGSFKTVELSVEGDAKTIEGKVASRRPFPFCWIDADDLSPLNRKAVSEAKPDSLKGGDTAYIAYKRSGKVHVHKGTITEFGAFKADFEYSPTQRGIVQVGPVFTAEGKLAGYGVRMDLGNDIKIYRLRRE